MFYSLQPTECCASWCTLSRQGVGIPACAACLPLLLEVLISSPVSRRGTELVPANAHTALSRLHLVPAPALALGRALECARVSALQADAAEAYRVRVGALDDGLDQVLRVGAALAAPTFILTFF